METTIRRLLDRPDIEAMTAEAAALRNKIFGKHVYFRGLIEFSNYCKNDCLYCGLRHSRPCTRYRMSEAELMHCAAQGFAAGFRTFVLQSGEDPYFTCEKICALVSKLKENFPEAAVTLSLGERPQEEYAAFFRAGADRYLLRHETADPTHYARLHPKALSLETRKRCLYDLKDLGFQVGTGLMVGSPGQTKETLLADFQFMCELEPHMIGIGPFLPAQATPFAGEPAGDLQMTLRLIAMARLLFPHALIPATTALASLVPNGRELGLMAGANVVMPNLTPPRYREAYAIYDHKLSTGAEAAESLSLLSETLAPLGLTLLSHRGDYEVTL